MRGPYGPFFNGDVSHLVLDPGIRPGSQGAAAPTTAPALNRVVLLVHRLTVGVFALVLFIAVALGLLARLSGSGAPRLLGREIRAVQSGSMSPAIGVGDAIVIRVASPNVLASIRPGSIITFRVAGRDSMVVTHRVTAISVGQTGRRVFTTKGDANGSVDSTPVGETEVIGVHALSIPRLGFVLNSLNDRRSLVVFLLASLLASAALALARRANTLTPVAHPEQTQHQTTSVTDNQETIS